MSKFDRWEKFVSGVLYTDFDRIEAPKYENRSRKRKKISFRLPPCSLSEWNWKKCDQSHAQFNEHCKNWFSILFSRQGYNYAGILSDQLYLERTEKRSVRNVKTKSSLLIFLPPSSLFLRSVLATIQTLPDGRFNSRKNPVKQRDYVYRPLLRSSKSYRRSITFL